MRADEVAAGTGIAGLVAALARIATPPAIASLSQIAMGLIDTILPGHLGGGALLVATRPGALPLDPAGAEAPDPDPSGFKRAGEIS